ncbi:MAG: N-formylglutamate amidohydrolase [Pirellulales bacterium]|nr:N-formylglutamate amidohydrolase [Pirellulales bacterium]
MPVPAVPLPRFLVTCEHGGNRVPPEYAGLFRGKKEVLASHRGYDLGALELARRFARGLDCVLVASTTTRLLVDLNRSLGHPKLFSEYAAALDRASREQVLAKHYHPHRARVEAIIREAISQGRTVLHLAVHSFTPVLDGEVRRADIGLLYDPSRSLETGLCRRWQQSLQEGRPELRVRRNYPYLGTADGMATHFRREFGPGHYAGIELEVNQSWPDGDRRRWLALQRVLVETLTRLPPIQ